LARKKTAASLNDTPVKLAIVSGEDPLLTYLEPVVEPVANGGLLVETKGTKFARTVLNWHNFIKNNRNINNFTP
jgi:hypothetical protein